MVARSGFIGVLSDLEASCSTASAVPDNTHITRPKRSFILTQPQSLQGRPRHREANGLAKSLQDNW